MGRTPWSSAPKKKKKRSLDMTRTNTEHASPITMRKSDTKEYVPKEPI